MVYFIAWDSLQIHEGFAVMNTDRKVVRELGNFLPQNASLVEVFLNPDRERLNLNLTYSRHQGLREDFIKRRSNFYGLQLKVVTEEDPPFIIFSKRFKENRAEFPVINDVMYEITGETSGLIHAVTESLAQTLNFTYRAYNVSNFFLAAREWLLILPRPTSLTAGFCQSLRHVVVISRPQP